MTQTRAAGPVAHGASARNAPNPVATPLPPRNRRKTGQQFPTMARTAPAAAHAGEASAARATLTAAIALHDVAEQGGDGGALAERPQHVGGADIAAARAPDVHPAAEARHDIADGNRADQVGGEQAQQPHGQRSRSLTSALNPVLRKKR